ncbi:ATP-dependent RNA helicase [Trichosporon asahii var. asahii CBS 2479]|uniref:ATP-dependent RNA helicase n=1 Tax=Trichosporon asahii var. asahii (strain ATCC 90039 / CBS 2479 / JCM 2466 / KCTC 7840 / NBRC 103889/ NCYC 2677 / UAMH 7654) TaxID=1186058 RepID=J5SYQ6_TRIAS|nr:ATP-dependent RNA helicase [Trichosporon asahii var. asahii CBS 2479]EJT48246.1 ATP-dependent RNA helicase [Trichosporon asahii var. asahii CBS 2479]
MSDTDSASNSRASSPANGADEPKKTFADLGVSKELCESCESLGFKHPTDIQVAAIPPALTGRDIIGIAQTGSAVLLAHPRSDSIAKQVQALGAPIGVRTAVIVGGMDMMSQSIALSKRPHIIVATPGRLMDHLENTKGFSLKALKYLVLDEADRLLDLDFGPIIDKLLKVIPKERNTFLFSATLSTKVEKLKRASLNKPIQVKVDSKYSTVSTLMQYYVFFPEVQKDAYLFYLVNELSSSSMIIFTSTVDRAQRLSIMLNRLGYPAIPLHGQMSQSARLGSLNKFKSGGRKILVATDVASRGLDIPSVDLVINFDIPSNSKDYVHRVGRTARAGRSGKSITLVTQYDVVMLKGIEAAIGRQLPAFDCDKEAVAILSDRVNEAARAARIEMRETGTGGAGGKRGRDKGRRGKDDDRDRDDDVVQGGMPKKKFKKRK